MRRSMNSRRQKMKRFGKRPHADSPIHPVIARLVRALTHPKSATQRQAPTAFSILPTACWVFPPIFSIVPLSSSSRFPLIFPASSLSLPLTAWSLPSTWSFVLGFMGLYLCWSCEEDVAHRTCSLPVRAPIHHQPTE